MERYTVRLFDAGGSRHSTVEREHGCDDEAIDAAGFLDHPHAIEVWQGDRLVATFPPERRPGR